MKRRIVEDEMEKQADVQLYGFLQPMVESGVVTGGSGETLQHYKWGNTKIELSLQRKPLRPQSSRK